MRLYFSFINITNRRVLTAIINFLLKRRKVKRTYMCVSVCVCV